jgi:hypothetical protein
MDTQSFVSLLNSTQFLSVIILLYAGPDQILPLMSLLGAILGTLLIFWQRFTSLVRRATHFLVSRLRPAKKKA